MAKMNPLHPQIQHPLIPGKRWIWDSNWVDTWDKENGPAATMAKSGDWTTVATPAFNLLRFIAGVENIWQNPECYKQDVKWAFEKFSNSHQKFYRTNTTGKRPQTRFFPIHRVVGRKGSSVSYKQLNAMKKIWDGLNPDMNTWTKFSDAQPFFPGSQKKIRAV